MKRTSFILVMLFSLCQSAFGQTQDDYLGTWEGTTKIAKGSVMYNTTFIITRIEGDKVYVSTREENTKNKNNVLSGDFEATLVDGGIRFDPTPEQAASNNCVGSVTYKIRKENDKLMLSGGFKKLLCTSTSINLVKTSNKVDNAGIIIKTTTDNRGANALIRVKADRFFPFNEGLAIVGYGNSYGVIDRTGNFIIPYNKFVFENFGLGSLEPEHGFVNGSCVVRNTTNGLFGLIDKKGTLIVPTEYILVYPFDNEGWARVTDTKEKDFFINRSGTKIPVPSAFYVYRNSLISSNGGIEDLFNGGPSRNRALSGKEYFGNFSKSLSPGRTEDGKYAFFNRAGKQIINGKYTSAESFSDGLACVSNTNEFGEAKYGFIDINGKVVIPYTFSKKPGNFKNGLAYVEPAINNEFDFAFINKKGEIVYKQKSAKAIFTGKKMPQFEDGYFRMLVKSGSSQTLKIIDSTGKDVSIINSLKDKIKGIDQNLRTTSGYYPFNNQTQIFNFQNGSKNYGVGFVNLRTGQIVYTNFIHIDKFDPVSGLALATDSKSDDQVYIDQSGNTVIGVANRSEW